MGEGNSVPFVTAIIAPMFVTVVSFLGFMWSVKADTKVLKTQVAALADATAAMQIDVSELKKVLVTLADHNGRMNLIDERLMAQGLRYDELQNRNNELQARVMEWMDRRDKD